MSLYTESSLERNITTDIGMNSSGKMNVLNFVLNMFKVDYKYIKSEFKNFQI